MSRRIRSFTWATGTLVLLTISATPVPADDQAAHSTLRVTLAGDVPANAVAPAEESTGWEEPPLTFELTEPEAASSPPTAPAHTQPPRAVRPANFEAPVSARPLDRLPTNGRSRPLAGIYASPSAQATLNRIPRPAPVRQASAQLPVAQSARSRGKPFQTIETEPAVSPYLNLYRTDLNPNTMPNYYALVRPQFEQIQANRKQAAEMQRLRTQMQSATPATGSPPSSSAYNSSSGGTRSSARFMDTAQFYQRVHR